MELIDKTALVAEIKVIISKLRKSCNPNPLGTLQECLTDAEIEALHLILDYIDTLEVKEVYLEEEIDEYMKLHHLHIKDGGRIVFENDDTPNFMCDFRDIANHFFELGLKAKGAEGICKI